MKLWRRLRRTSVDLQEPSYLRQWRREGFVKLSPDEAVLVPFPEGRRDDRFRWAYDDTVWERRR